MFTYSGRLTKFFFYLIFIAINVSCSIVLNAPSPLSQTLVFSTVTTVSSYTCAPISLNAVDEMGKAFPSTTNQSITLSGLGQGYAYASLIDCQSGANATTTVFLSAGTSNVTFYYRTSAAETLTFSATGSNLTSATLQVTTVQFQVLGQPGTTRMLQKETGENQPQSVFSDGTRLFVSDQGNSRVLVWNTIPTSSAQAPDFAVGQPDLVTTSCVQGSGSRLCLPIGVYSDGTRLFVADAGNNRVLVWSSMPTSSGQSASFAIGQPNLTSHNANNGGVSGTSLSYPFGVSGDGTHLFISDQNNSRVLVWNTIPTGFGQSASFALGQPNLTSGTSNNGGRTGTSLSYPYGVYSDGTRVFVADNGNRRVLVWSAMPSANGQSASFALGQANLTANTFAFPPNAASFTSPNGVFSDGTRLFVSDDSFNRVLVWNSLPTSFNQTSDLVLGQPDFTSFNFTGPTSGSTLYSPYGIYSDGTRLFIADTQEYRVSVWNTIPSTNGQAANFALGQTSLSTSNQNNGIAYSGSNFNSNASVYSDGTRLFVADKQNSRVLIWNTLPTSNGQSPDLVLGQPDFVSNTTNNGGISGSSLNFPTGVFSDGTQLFVADQGNNRILVWSSMPSSNAQAANFALGQPNLTSNTSNNGGISASSLSSPYGVYGDGTRLFVADTSNHRVLVWNTMPTSSVRAASFALGQPNLTSNTSNNGGISGSSLRFPGGVFSDGNRLFVADSNNHRLLVWNTLPTVSGQTASFALGQPNLTANTSNNGGISATTLSNPNSVFSAGNRLLVNDNLNNRVLVWNSIPTTNGQAADSVIGQPDLTSNSTNNGGITASSLNSPAGIFSDGSRVFIGDSSNDRVLIAPIPGI